MRLAKLSLAAIVALGVSAFADVENVKFGGDAKLYYGTTDENPNDLFDKDNSYGQAALDLYVTADVGDGAEAKIGVVMLNTLGLENNLVSGVWAGGLNNQWWVNEAWLAKSFGNTTFKVGRQELDTPLAFSEKWNIAANSFDAAVLLNNDLPQTTLVAAFVGRGNGTFDGHVVTDASGGNDPFRTFGSAIVQNIHNSIYEGLLTANGGDEQQAATDSANAMAQLKIKAKGAYAVGAVTKLIPMTTAQVWYYNVQSIADAWWLQADVDLKEVLPGLTFGAQFANISLDDEKRIKDALNTKIDDSQAWAVKLGYTMENGLKASIAYSSVEEDGLVAVANTATGLGASQTKLYTDAWWNYGYVGAPNADTWHIELGYNMEGVADFGAYYTKVNDAENNKLMDLVAGQAVEKNDLTEFTLTASKSFGSLDATLAYIYTDADDQNKDDNGKADSYNTIQVYLTYNF